MLWLVESSGGIDRGTLRYLNHLAKRITGAAGSDRTVYGSTRVSTKSFYSHHTQQMSKAAVMYDAKAIRMQITYLKQHAFGCAVRTADADAGGEQA